MKLEFPIATPLGAPQSRIEVAGKIFTRDGVPWRWKGVSAFPLCRRFTDGEDIDPFLSCFPLYNVLRVWDYVTWPGPPTTPYPGWNSCTPSQWAAFITAVGRKGWTVELTLLTDDDPARIEPAQALVNGLAPYKLANLVIEIGNEPMTHKAIDCRALEAVCRASGYLWTSGIYEDSHQFFGLYGVTHTPRDSEWPRKAHDMLEYWGGGGPHDPSEPPCHVPWVADEPIRPDEAGYVETDYYAYGAACAGFGAGATFHFGSGRNADPPTADEQACADAMVDGLDAYAEDAALGNYGKIDEGDTTLRTYTWGKYCCRIRPTNNNTPGAWTVPLDAEAICWCKP